MQAIREAGAARPRPCGAWRPGAAARLWGAVTIRKKKAGRLLAAKKCARCAQGFLGGADPVGSARRGARRPRTPGTALQVSSRKGRAKGRVAASGFEAHEGPAAA